MMVQDEYGEKLKMRVISAKFPLLSRFQGTDFEAIHSDISELWAICMHYLGTAQQKTSFGIFCKITQNTTPEENSQKMLNISSPIVLFSYREVKDILV